MSTFQMVIGSVVFGAVLFAAVAWMLLTAVKHLEPRDAITQPEDVVERLAALTPGTVFTDTAQKRAEQKRRLQLVASKARGHARLMTFLPKDVA